MNITAGQRRKVFKLFNVAEAARHVGIDPQWLYRDIRSGAVFSPKVTLGRRLYFTENELDLLSSRYQLSWNREAASDA